MILLSENRSQLSHFWETRSRDVKRPDVALTNRGGPVIRQSL